MAISLDSIQQTKHATPPRILIHAPPKIGKSTFFAGDIGRDQAGAPSPVFVQTEDGLNGINANAFPLATTYQEAYDALLLLATSDHDFETVVLDSADWLEKLIHARVCADENTATIELAGGGYGKGYQLANNYWRDILTLLNRLNKDKNMIIGVICHSRLKKVNDPELEPYDYWQMKLHSPGSGNGACEMLNEWADIIGFAKCETFQKKKKTTQGDGSEIFSATGTGQRVLCLENNPAYLAGNRYNLPAKIPLAWSALMDALA